jgi:hypothetical protein
LIFTLLTLNKIKLDAMLCYFDVYWFIFSNNYFIFFIKKCYYPQCLWYNWCFLVCK